MLKAMSTDDMAEASRLAAIIAEYEQPKLQRTENINTNFDFTDLTDEELEAEMARLNSQ
jgi:bacterioferritin (cytochrome b1)